MISVILPLRTNLYYSLLKSNIITIIQLQATKLPQLCKVAASLTNSHIIII